MALYAVVAVERAPGPQRLQQNLLVLLGDGLVQLALLRHFREQLGNLSLEIGLDRADPLRLAAERARGVEQRVVIELDERLERDAEAPAIIQQRAMVIGNPPRTRIDIEALLETRRSA